MVFWSDEDEGFIATAPDLPGASAFGSSPEEAISELQSAIEAWIGAAKSAGNPVPAPSKVSSEPQPSGHILMRIPIERAKHWRGVIFVSSSHQFQSSTGGFVTEQVSTASSAAVDLRVHVAQYKSTSEAARGWMN